MSTTNLDIISRAFVLIGGSAVQDLAEQSREAEIAAVTYDSIKESELSSYYWNFALSYFELNKSATAPLDTNYTAAFSIPTTVLRIKNIVNESNVNVDYQIRDDKVLTSSTRAFVLGIVDTPESKWRGYFIKSVMSRCAMEWAIPLREKATLHDRMLQQYGLDLAQAKIADAQENPPSFILSEDNSPLEKARVN